MNNKTLIKVFAYCLVTVALIYFGLAYLLEASKPIVLKQPSRAPYENCKWEEVNGVGLKFWGMRCGEMYMTTFNDRGTATLVDNSSGTKIRAYDYVTIFNIKNNDINTLLPELRKSEKWYDNEDCQFKPGIKVRDGVTRYDIFPTGDGLIKYEKESKDSPINYTCGGFGMANDSGLRYFEIHDSNPGKALFLQLGQDAPMIDEATIEVLK